MNLVDKAKEIMTQAHKDQTRWDGRPYSVHPEKVVSILYTFTPYNVPEEIVCAAYLHDVLEDTDYSEISLKTEFGDEVYELVKELTMPQGLSDEQYLEHCKKLSFDAKHP